jgi:hypothetical protein
LNQYSKAVQFLQQYLDATNNVFEDQDLPQIETQLEYAMKILRSHQDYDGPNVSQQ